MNICGTLPDIRNVQETFNVPLRNLGRKFVTKAILYMYSKKVELDLEFILPIAYQVPHSENRNNLS